MIIKIDIKTLDSRICASRTTRDRGHRTYGRVGGNYGGYYVFGEHMKDSPAKVIRWLRIMETMLNDEKLLLHCSLGKEGVHWKWRGR